MRVQVFRPGTFFQGRSFGNQPGDEPGKRYGKREKEERDSEIKQRVGVCDLPHDVFGCLTDEALKGIKNGKVRTTPRSLNRICAKATRLASVVVPRLATQAVAQVPTFAPRMMGMAEDSGISPWVANAIAIPMVAALLESSAVRPAEIKIPQTGTSLTPNSTWCTKPFSLSGAMPSERSFKAKKIRPKPKRTVPTNLIRRCLLKK